MKLSTIFNHFDLIIKLRYSRLLYFPLTKILISHKINNCYIKPIKNTN